MSERVAFLPAGAKTPVPFASLGAMEEGSWGLVADEPWLAVEGDDPLELLYLSRVGYERAVRGLPAKEVPAVIARRRESYSRKVPDYALGIFEASIRTSLALVRDQPAGARARADLLIALATFTQLSRWRGFKPLELLDLLRNGDAKIMAELEALALDEPNVFDRDGSERETRLRFATALGQIEVKRGGHPAKATALPYRDVERVYLVVPGLPDLEERAAELHDPIRKWRGGLVLPVSVRHTAGLIARGQQLLALFPSAGDFRAAISELSPSQLEVELAKRTLSPGFAAYLDSLRVNQALLRSAAYLLMGGDGEINRALAEQTRQEAALLGVWLRSSTARPDQARATLLAAIGKATLLAALCRRRQDWARADKLDALSSAITHVVAEGI